jgi:hypothetical protein
MVLAALLIAGCSGHSIDAARPVRDLHPVEARLKDAVAACDRLSLRTVGEVRYGDFTAPIWCVSYAPNLPVKRRVLLTGSIHGNEPAGCERLLRFVEDLSTHADRFPGIAFDIIPLVNPWGWVHNRRHNQADLDLNRDFASFRGAESKIIRDFIKEQRYDLIVDHHEDGSATGFYIFELDNKGTPFSKRIIDEERKAGNPIEQNVWMVFLKTQDGIIHAPRWALKLARLIHQLSMTNYFRLTACDQVFLFETPARLPMDQRVAMDEKALRVLLEE